MHQIMRDLWKAACSGGDVSILNSLIQRDPSILSNTTALHISALLNRHDFTEVLLNRNPLLATGRDSSGRTALHLASAEGNSETVQKLLEFNHEPCLLLDTEERIPLHYAAMRGKTEVVQDLIKEKPESLGCRDGAGSTVFHLCVIYNQLETLKTLVKFDHATASITDDDHQCHPIFTLPDFDDNTILHLAVEYKRVEVVRYLLSIPNIRELANKKNSKGRTARGMLEHSLQDFKTLEMQHLLKNAGKIKAETNGKCWRKILGFMEHVLKHNESNWLEEMRGNLSLVAAMISSITFQAVINPPGGFIQQGIASDQESPFKCVDFGEMVGRACPGDAVSAIRYTSYFHPYLKFNTTCFIGSLCVLLLLVSGVPLQHKVVIWVISAGMWITLTFLTLTYLNALYVVTPDILFKSAWKMVIVSVKTWIGFLVFVALFITLRFVFWLGKKLKTFINCKKKTFRTRNRNENV